MLLQTVRPNIVQSIRAYRVDDLMQAAAHADQHFLYANLTTAQSKQEVLEGIAEAFLFPTHFGKNLDALYDCMTSIHDYAIQQYTTSAGTVLPEQTGSDQPESTVYGVFPAKDAWVHGFDQRYLSDVAGD